MNKYEFKNNQFEISDARKRFLINKFAEQHHKSGKNDDSEYIYDIVERMDNDFKIPLNTPLKSFDNEMFIKQQKLVVDCEPAIAIDWVASLVSHMKKITNLDSPKVLQVFSDNVYLQKALSHCSIETVAYQQNKRQLFSDEKSLPYKTAESAIRKHSDDIDIILIVIPFPQKEHVKFIEKYEKRLKGKHVVVLCANKKPFAGFQISRVLGQLHRKVIIVNDKKTPLIHATEHKDEFYDLVAFSKLIE